MPQTTNARPVAGNSGAGAKTAGEHVPDSVTDLADITPADVLSLTTPPAWLYRRGGDPVTARRRAAARLGDLLDASRLREAEPYAAGGMTLGVPEREAAADAPLVCAA
ncbi:hypothetical protein [Micromonospora sp. NPDC126480]|uniref:hypothetical protein n=1 Tax=Micromonospora sp. NPDC126480 TaxID=3155312 RepID=UPI00331CE594